MRRLILWIDANTGMLIGGPLAFLALSYLIGNLTAMALGYPASPYWPALWRGALIGDGAIGTVTLTVWGSRVAWRAAVAWAKRPISTCASCCLKWSPLNHLTCPRCAETARRINTERVAMDPFLIAAQREVDAIAPEEAHA